jgi:hypothetical protein
VPHTLRRILSSRPARLAGTLGGALVCVFGGPTVAACQNYSDAELGRLGAIIDRDAHEAVDPRVTAARRLRMFSNSIA